MSSRVASVFSSFPLKQIYVKQDSEDRKSILLSTICSNDIRLRLSQFRIQAEESKHLHMVSWESCL